MFEEGPEEELMFEGFRVLSHISCCLIQIGKRLSNVGGGFFIAQQHSDCAAPLVEPDHKIVGIIGGSRYSIQSGSKSVSDRFHSHTCIANQVGALLNQFRHIACFFGPECGEWSSLW